MIGVENYNCLSIIPVTNGQHDSAQKLKNTNKNSWGLIIALSILMLWSITTFVSLSIDLSFVSLWKLLILILVQTFFNTGLFITAHDGMHGSISSNSLINHSIGSMAVNLYALFSYQELRQRHFLHHLHPATDLDPDYYHHSNSSFVIWYVEFILKYMSSQQLLKLLFLVFVMMYFAQISWLNLILCWVLPLILSSLQLFTFGTFFPHRRLENEPISMSQIKSLNFSPFWSFIACYNFSYHWEHHQYPQLPWWRLAPLKIYPCD